jgi:enediyne biosynthesis protein E3
MAVPLRRLRRRVFRISRRDWSFAGRGFPEANLVKRPHLERIRRTFVDGDHATLEERRPQTLALWLNTIDPQFRGFAFEGVTLSPQNKGPSSLSSVGTVPARW